MGLSVFPSTTRSIKYDLIGFSIASHDEVLTELCPQFGFKAFSGAYIFENEQDAKRFFVDHIIDQHQFSVVKVFHFLKCLGYATLDYSDDLIQEVMNKEKSFFLK